MMEEWFSTGGADGFNVLPPFFPNSLDEFVALVVPELQRRGLYRTAYTRADAARQSRPAAAREPARRPRCQVAGGGIARCANNSGANNEMVISRPRNAEEHCRCQGS